MHHYNSTVTPLPDIETSFLSRISDWQVPAANTNGAYRRNLAQMPEIDDYHRFTGVAFNQNVEAFSADIGIPNLDSIQDSLGLVSNGLERFDEQYRHFHWLGFYRLEDGGIFGVVIDLARISRLYKVVAFHTDQGHVTVDLNGSGDC